MRERWERYLDRFCRQLNPDSPCGFFFPQQHLRLMLHRVALGQMGLDVCTIHTVVGGLRHCHPSSDGLVILGPDNGSVWTAAMQARSPPVSVLLVEDSAIMGNLLSRLVDEQPCLRLYGTVKTAAEAVAAIESMKPDVTVLDLMLDGGSGFDVLRALNGRPGPRPNVVVLTNLAGEPYRERAIQLGATHFFDKSSEIPVMLRVLIGLAEQRRGDRPHRPGYERLV